MSDANPQSEETKSNPAGQQAQAADQWTDLCEEGELQQGIGKYVKCGDLRLAVFKEKDSIHVVDDECPHAGASLSTGFVEDGSIVCPWHYWTFNAKTGECHSCPGADIGSYESRVQAGKVQVLVSAK